MGRPTPAGTTIARFVRGASIKRRFCPKPIADDQYSQRTPRTNQPYDGAMPRLIRLFRRCPQSKLLVRDDDVSNSPINGPGKLLSWFVLGIVTGFAAGLSFFVPLQCLIELRRRWRGVRLSLKYDGTLVALISFPDNNARRD
jgi:hypothetical protein